MIRDMFLNSCPYFARDVALEFNCDKTITFSQNITLRA